MSDVGSYAEDGTRPTGQTASVAAELMFDGPGDLSTIRNTWLATGVMRAIADTGPILAFLDTRDPLHSWAQEAFNRCALPLITREAARMVGTIRFLFGAIRLAPPRPPP